MLAGVLLQLCLAPFKALGTVPVFVAPVIVCWLVMMKFAPRWAVPAALLLALVVIGISLAAGADRHGPRNPHTCPGVDHSRFQPAGSLAGIAVPVVRGDHGIAERPRGGHPAWFGYETTVAARDAVTGSGTVLGAPFGGHASILQRSAPPWPQARRPARTGAGGGSPVLVRAGVPGLAAFSAALVTVVAAAPGLLEAVAGLALLGTLASAVGRVGGPEDDRTVGHLPDGGLGPLRRNRVRVLGARAGILVRWVHTGSGAPN